MGQYKMFDGIISQYESIDIQLFFVLEKNQCQGKIVIEYFTVPRNQWFTCPYSKSTETRQHKLHGVYVKECPRGWFG